MIALITAFYDENYRYLEVQIARSLLNLGYEVQVFSTNRALPNCDVPLEQSQHQKVAVWRSQRNVRFGDSVFSFDTHKVCIRPEEYRAVIVLAPNFIFPFQLLRKFKRSGVQVISFFSDHEHNMTKIWYRRLLNKYLYPRVSKMSQSLALATPDTNRMLLNYGVEGDVLAEKVDHVGLLVSNDSVQFDPVEGLSLDEDRKWLVCITQVRGRKAVKEFLKQVDIFLSANPEWSLFFGGFLENAESKEALEYAASLGSYTRMRLVGRLQQDEVFHLFTQAERVLFFSATISVQQAMLLGCPVLLPKSRTLGALLQEPENGFYYGDYQEADEDADYPYPHLLQGLADALERSKSHLFSRKELQQRNKNLSGEWQLGRLLDCHEN